MHSLEAPCSLGCVIHCTHIIYVKKDPAIDSTVFKSIMIGIATVTAAILMVWFFRKVRTSYTRGR
jgi:hypothetical protein